MKASAMLLVLMLAPVPLAADEPVSNELSGRELMESVRSRHWQYPYVFEEQSMVLTDRHGRRETRRVRSYTRVESDGVVRFMLLFDTPAEVEGVAIMAIRDASGETRSYFYLPAYGEDLLEATGENVGGNFLGTDFAIEDLTGEPLDEFEYVRQRDRSLNGVNHHVVEAYRNGSSQPELRHFIVIENQFISRTDHIDLFGRIRKRQTFHDIRSVGGGVWRANIVRMDNIRSQHQSLIRIERRIFSRDYVPAEMFSAQWLVENHRPLVANTLEGSQ